MRSGRSGFTLIESLIVLALLGLTMLLGYPALMNSLNRARMTATASSIVSAMQLARLEAIKRAGTVVRLELDYSSGTLIGYVDENADGSFGSGDRQLSSTVLPTGLRWHGPGDDSTPNLNAAWNFALNAAGNPFVVFNSDGSSSTFGAFRIRDRKGNILEVRVQPQATARLAVQKFTQAPDGSDAPNDETAWVKQDQGWTWN